MDSIFYICGYKLRKAHSNTMEKILYVDDEDLNLQLFKLNFRKDYDVITMASPNDSLIAIENRDIKVVITDFKMPNINGMQLIEMIKTVRPDVVCILLSGFMESEVVTDKSKVFSYIMKPYKKDDVLKTLERAFDHYSIS